MQVVPERPVSRRPRRVSRRRNRASSSSIRPGGGLKGMLTTYRDGRWLLMFSDDAERDEATLRAKVLQAIGRSDVDVELLTTGRWVLSALVADRFSSGRVFLAGDAAHLAAGPGWLRSEHRHRRRVQPRVEARQRRLWRVGPRPARDLRRRTARPIAWLRHDQIFARRDYAAWATDEEKKVAIIDDDAMELGQLYRSKKAVIGAGDEGIPPAIAARAMGRSARHARAAPLGIGARRKQVSTLDLLQREWMLVTEDSRWCDAAARAGAQLGLSLASLHIGGAVGDGGLPLSPSNRRRADVDASTRPSNRSPRSRKEKPRSTPTFRRSRDTKRTRRSSP